MRVVILILGLAAAPSQADLYRWVDPESGSVKFSSYPPPWFGDPGREIRAPAVEVIRYQPPAAPQKAVKPAAAKPPAPTKPPAQ